MSGFSEALVAISALFTWPGPTGRSSDAFRSMRCAIRSAAFFMSRPHHDRPYRSADQPPRKQARTSSWRRMVRILLFPVKDVGGRDAIVDGMAQDRVEVQAAHGDLGRRRKVVRDGAFAEGSQPAGSPCADGPGQPDPQSARDVS